MPPGLIDTNVFIHALTDDPHSEECMALLRAVERGDRVVRLEPLVLHELSYVLGRYLKGITRADAADYLLAVLAWEGVVGDKSLMIDSVRRWRDDGRVGFVDAYLGALAVLDDLPVYTKNTRDLRAEGALVPDPLPA